MVDLDTLSDSFGQVGHALGRGLNRIFGSRNARVVQKYRKAIQKIDLHKEWATSLSQDDVIQQTAQWRADVAQGA
ncbi:MAG: hypothetical protein OTJ44_07765, partial [Planctomycetota bacterium]|nr:hypothetical protein [Planctomycetota bacterium]